MDGQQLDIFGLMFDNYKITKPIRLIEFFAGIGSQYKALKVLTDKVESYKICEWAYNSYCAYNSIHIKDFKDYSQGKSIEQCIERIKGTSTNYNDPLSLEQIKKKGESWIRNAYNNCVATHNLINIMEVHGKDLEIVDTDKYEYVLTYSFPCQDLSLAGKRAGMSVSQADGGTRSGLLWEVERILDECNVLGKEHLPQILLMENVPQVIGTGAIQDFQKWQRKLESLGYSNYVKVLDASKYGIPQHRERCFMVSILGEYAYMFPHKTGLKYKLKDLLEQQVDEKYYLSDKMIEYLTGANQKESKFPRGDRFEKTLKNTNCKGIASSITTLAGNRPTDNFIYNNKALNETLEKNIIEDGTFIDAYNRSIKNETTGTITIRVSESNNTFIAVKTANSQGYIEARDGDGIDISGRMEYHRGTVQKGKTQTLSTQRGNNNGVVVSDDYVSKQIKNAINKNNGEIPQTIDVYNAQPRDNNISTTITTCSGHLGGSGSLAICEKQTLRIRKLTPLECTKLMAFERQDYQAMKDIGMSDASIYHCCGDSICVNVLIGIFGELLGVDSRQAINDYIEQVKCK